MMRSQSEEYRDVEPLRLHERVRHREREVARLEFHCANRIPEEVATELSSAAEARPVVEVDALREEFRLQTVQFQTEMEEARRKAADATRAECSDEFERSLAIERERTAKFWAQFDRERSQYFASAEAGVVKLALAIATQVLHREVKLDPLLLRGVVRVALEQVRDAGAVVLRVPTSELDAWKENFVRVADATLQVVGDDRLTRGDCLLESSAGSADLGIQAQLHEIERGFFDLLEKRPA